jgi:hypothetical protein
MALDAVIEYSDSYQPYPQTALVGTNPQLAAGICASLVGGWARRLISTGFDRQGVPRETPSERLESLGTQITEVRANQLLFVRRNQIVLDSAAQSRYLVVDVYPIILNHGLQTSNPEIIAAAETLRRAALQNVAELQSRVVSIRTVRVSDNMVNLMRAYRLTLPEGREGAIAKIDDAALLVHDTIKKKEIWLIDTGSHAIGVYRTGGVLYTDCYIYDPNFGEFRASSSSRRGFALFALLRTIPEYAVPKYKFYRLTG